MIAYNRAVASRLKVMGGDSDTRSGTKDLYRNFYVLQDRTIALFRCRHICLYM